ncbi:MAG: hypothetical protein COV66_14725 [Nitrospinae bacterium CG11_big_fil_rev_8_21_14_0_20_45_15]|nr:MAG: hypothetical protein COV66_14725 [Nitrospinae bacterium CG11_big_fil_rev_8_21_14_0_20_45_15]
MKKHLVLIILTLLITANSTVFAEVQGKVKVPAPVKDETPGKTELSNNKGNSDAIEGQILPKPIEKTQFQLLQITKRILFINNEIKKLEKQEPSTEEIARIGELQSELKNLNNNYESLATQIPKVDVSKSPLTKKGWMDEIQEITRPILNSLADFTERPRKMDSLKAKILDLRDKVEVYRQAQKNILDLQALSTKASDIIKADKKDSISSQAIQKKFEEDLSKLKNNYNPEIILLELDEAERTLQSYKVSDKGLFLMIRDSFTEFMAVRGRNLAVAIGLLFGVWWILNRIYKIIETRTQYLNKISRSTRKFIKAVYSLVIFLISFTSSLVSLYLLDDWLLLSLLFLVLAAIGWSSRQFIPRFIKELHMILNMGTVREGERIFFEGIPWLIKEIGFHGILHNPRLQGGIIRIPVGKLVGLSSRQFVKEEDWFPTKVGDWVLIGDSCCQVLSQTPEQVVVKYKESKMNYLTTEFLTLKPMNLSSGFVVVVVFGLDYSIQSKICDEIPDLFQARLEEIFKASLNSQPPAMDYIKTKFSSAAASALEIIVIAGINGMHAENYFSIKRDITKSLVMICNENGFTIPFNQMTVSFSGDQVPVLKQ